MQGDMAKNEWHANTNGNYNISSGSINKIKLNGKQYGELHYYQF